MIKIEYPQYAFRMKVENEREFIFDELRKLWLHLTPEEWVRQNFVQYLIRIKKYPATLIAIEKKIFLGELTKRFDVLVYNADHLPWMIIECKAMGIMLSEKVLEQVLRYNISVPVQYLVITNGEYCMAYEKSNNQLKVMDQFPAFQN